MKTKEITLYDNYPSVEKENETRKFLFEVDADEENWKSPEEIPDQRVYDEIDFQDGETWRDVKDGLNTIFEDGYYLLTGYFGGWRGRLDGGNFIRSLDDLIRVIQHLDYIKITDCNGHLIIEGSHHDGNDRYELKRLTRKGYEYADRNYFARDRELHNTIMRCNFYSALPKFAKRIYGL